jgi:hypothetical protein
MTSRTLAVNNNKMQATRKILTLNTINQHILNTKYAVRGELAIRADQITKVKTIK